MEEINNGDNSRYSIRNTRSLSKALALKAYRSLSDTGELLAGKRDRFTPPKSRRATIGDGDFITIGEEFLEIFTEIAGLRPDDTVLDVGCGIGRMSIPLTGYLSNDGRYEGFDIVPSDIRWLKKRVASRHPNFHFQVANIYNRMYNPKGKYDASEFVFPYETSHFDFVFAASVFTHLLPAPIEHYLSEVSRVLKPGGRCLITFFLTNDESLELMGRDKSMFDFRHDFGGCLTVDLGLPEKAVGYHENRVVALHEQYGLDIEFPIRYGAWCGRDNSLSGQDIVLATKKQKS